MGESSMGSASSSSTSATPSPNTNGVYSDFRWTYFSSLSEGPQYDRAHSFLKSVDWDALVQCAIRLRNEVCCTMLSHVGLGYNHMIRVLRFVDGVQWVARLQLPSLDNGPFCPDAALRMKCEASTITLVGQRSRISVPRIYALESDSNCSVRAPFMLMDCLDGNGGMDFGMRVPGEHQQAFYKELAGVHVELSTIKLPMIGTVEVVNEDGTVRQGPIPGIGGPFATATEYFEAWCANAKFGIQGERLRQACGSYYEELIPSITSFPKELTKVVDRLSAFDKGPFPLVHGDFGHHNIVVDNDYRIVGLIDWEHAFAAPWEIAGDFPLTLSTVPPAMCLPENYNEMGIPRNADDAKRFADQVQYIIYVEHAEAVEGLTGSPLISDLLRDSPKQRLMSAISRFFTDGKAGFYTRLLRDHL